MQERRSTAAMARAPVATLCLAAAVLLLATAAAPCSAQAATVMSIEEACWKAVSVHAGVSYEHCVSSLASDARSRDAADLHNLAVLAARMPVDHAATTEARMEDLNKVEESPHARARLHHCLELYNAAADVLRDALDNLHARIYGEDVWKGEERVPIASHDSEYGRMALVALGLTSGIA